MSDLQDLNDDAIPNDDNLQKDLNDDDDDVNNNLKSEAEEEEGNIVTITCGTSKGPFTFELHEDWSPNGFKRALELFQRGFYDNSHFFRVVPNFLVQFGISYSTDKELQKMARQQIADDPKIEGMDHFKPGYISYAGSGPNSRSSQLFISYGTAASLGKEKWETPIGKVISGMENVKEFYSYGDMPPWGKGPVQGKIHGNKSYITDGFPLTDHFEKCLVDTMKTKQNEPPLLRAGGDDVAIKKPRSFRAGGPDVAKHRPLFSVTHMNEDSDPTLIILVVAFSILGIVFMISNSMMKKQKENKSV